MNITENEALQIQVNHLLAENESLKTQLLDYKYVIDARDREIGGLLRTAAEADELKSDLDIKSEELEYLQNNIGKLQQQAEGSTGRGNEMNLYIKDGIKAEYQLADLKQQYTYLQTQLTDLQAQLQAMSDRNVILQQQLSQMAELESLLSNAEEERDEWQARAEEAEANNKES